MAEEPQSVVIGSRVKHFELTNFHRWIQLAELLDNFFDIAHGYHPENLILLPDVPSHLPVLPPKEQQWLTLPHQYVLNFCDKDGVVARRLRRVQTALQVRERPIQHRSAMLRPVKSGSGLGFGALLVALGAREILRNCPLILAEYINPESLLRVQVSVRARRMIHANQHQRRIERHRRKRVGGHTMDTTMPFSFQVNGDDGHPGGELPHRSSELGRIQTHGPCLGTGSKPQSTRTATLPRHVVSFEQVTLSSISREAAIRLIGCPDYDLPELLAAARAAKERFKPGVITYSRKVFLPLTNLCRDYCGYCTFRRDPGDPGAHTMTPDEVLAVARAGENLGCTEALFSLGDKPDLLFPEMRETLRHLGYKSTLHYLEAMCELVLRETSLLPHPNPGLLSAEWVARLAAVSPSMGLMLETTNVNLLAPGAAHDNAPDKVPARRLKTIEEAGKQNVPFTTGLLIGIGESLEDRVDTLLAIRDLHEQYGHIQEVIVQNFRVKPTIPMAHWPEPSQGDMLRTVAVARLLLPSMNIQAPPNLSAPYYEELLDAGINDWGGISPLTPDFINPEMPWPHLEQLRLRTEAKGAVLRQRLPVYPEYVSRMTDKPGLLSEKLRAATGGDGLARRAA